MSFDRSRLPDAATYYENQGLTLKGRGQWRTAACKFHDGSDSLRINLETGGFVCMAGCGAKGGDVLAYHQAAHGFEFVDAAKDLGCWIDDGQPAPQHKPTALSAREALRAVAHEAHVVAFTAGNLAHGVVLTDADRLRVLQSAARINRVMEMFA